MSRSKWIRKTTPELAWQQYVDASVELFISNFYYEGINDIREMCRIYTKDIQGDTSYLFTVDQLERLAKLLENYIYSYIEKMGGLEQLTLYTEQELDEIDARETKKNLDLLEEVKRHWY